MEPDRVEVVVSEEHGPRARYRPRVVLAGRQLAPASGETPLVLGPLAVQRLYRSAENGPAEHGTSIARALAADLHAQLAEVPDAHQVDALLTGVELLRLQLVRLRATVPGGGAA